MTDWIIAFIETVHYAGIAGLMFIETFLPVVQSEIVMPFSGFTANRSDDLNVVLVGMAGIIGSELGAITLYLISRRIAYERIECFLCKYGNWLGFTRENLKKWSARFDEHASITVVIGRFLPGLRAFIAIPAGLRNMPLMKFAVANLLGTAFWVSILTASGYYLGDNYHLVSRYSSYINYALLGGVISYVLYRLYRHFFS